MVARKEPTSALTIVANVNLSLRCLACWVDDKGRPVVIDQAIVAFALHDRRARPVPICCGGIPAETISVLIKDDVAGTWTDENGRVYSDWKEALTTCWAVFDAAQARKAEPKPAPDPAPGIRLGPVPGQTDPQPWKEPRS